MRTRNEPRACESGCRGEPGARIAHRRCACVRGREQMQTRCASCSPQVRGRARLGADANTVRVLLTAGAAGASSCGLEPTGARRGHAPGMNRVRARAGADANPVRVLLTAGARACEAGRVHKPGARLAHRRCVGVRERVQMQTGSANCPPQARRCGLWKECKAARDSLP